MTGTQGISVPSGKFPQEDNILGVRCNINGGPLGELQVVLGSHSIDQEVRNVYRSEDQT